ncbi:hypothetical protein CBR_g4064 [Chara braunii]|uniref:BED-type domain-containing protein n=1 Tax=Chara braunii TaxID=69332 RepID=A0A388KH54_CHABU|nr:hypothetical protein CBR_g4064 [Chara braunii]|eukprot:GBG69371.1 hypothetical protein CBR_g4064 [Chara braunii]
MQGQRATTWEKMYGDQKLRCNLCKHVWQGNMSKAARHFVHLKECRTTQMDMLVDVWNGTNYTFMVEHVPFILSYIEEKGIKDARSVVGHSRTRVSPSTAPRDEAKEREMRGHEGGDLSGGVDSEGEEVVLTSHGAGPKEKGKKTMDGDDFPLAAGKRVRQSRIDKVYEAEKQWKFCDKFQETV